MYSRRSWSITSGRRGANDHAVGLVEVVDRRAFFEKLRVAGDVEGHVGDLGHLPGQLGIGSDGHRALDDDRLVAGQILGDLAADGPDPVEVGAAVLALGGADGDEDQVGVDHAVSQAGGELEPAVTRVPVDQLGQAGLVDRDLTRLEHLDLGGDLIDADHVVAAFGQAGAGHQAYIPRSDDGNFHGCVPSNRRRAGAVSLWR